MLRLARPARRRAPVGLAQAGHEVGRGFDGDGLDGDGLDGVGPRWQAGEVALEGAERLLA
jgi:hypothetical protein